MPAARRSRLSLPASARPIPSTAATSPNTDIAAQAAQILGVDAAFSAASVSNGSGPAFEQYAAPNAIAIGGGEFVFGPTDIGAAFTGGPNDVVSWVPLHSGAAASGDLGFSVGEAVFVIEGAGTFYSKYLTIWQKQNTGEWRFVADEGNSAGPGNLIAGPETTGTPGCRIAVLRRLHSGSCPSNPMSPCLRRCSRNRRRRPGCAI